MNLLLDTCVLSEGTRRVPDPAVVAWMTAQDADQLFISAVTLGELHFGVARLSAGAKRRSLQAWLLDVEQRYSGRIVVLDDKVAMRWGQLRAAHPGAAVVDGQIAATAMAYDMKLVTRNVKDFRIFGLGLINPWDAP